MDSFEQQPFSSIEFAENPEPRCPCVLLLDNSGSMRGEKITQLNEGVAYFQRELLADHLARKRVEVAVITFGPVKVWNDFQSAEVFAAPMLQPDGETPMGAAVEKALQLLRERKSEYRAAGVSCYRPWLFLITDGQPTDSITKAAELLKQGEQTKDFVFFAVGVQGVDMGRLGQLCPPGRDPVQLKGLDFRGLFKWLSSSLKQVSRSNPGEHVPLENPCAPSGWAFV
jgi:uncharacterized protein YegL